MYFLFFFFKLIDKTSYSMYDDIGKSLERSKMSHKHRKLNILINLIFLIYIL